MKETLRRGRKKAFVHRSSCPAFLLHLSVCPLRAWWVPGTLGSYLCNLFHAPSYCPAPVGFQEVLQGCCHVKLPALSSSGRMEQCKELLLLSFLVFTKVIFNFTSSICCAVFFQHLCKLCFSIPPYPPLFALPSPFSGCFLDQRAVWCFAVYVPGGIAVYVLPEVRKQAGNFRHF